MNKKPRQVVYKGPLSVSLARVRVTARQLKRRMSGNLFDKPNNKSPVVSDHVSVTPACSLTSQNPLVEKLFEAPVCDALVDAQSPYRVDTAGKRNGQGKAL